MPARPPSRVAIKCIVRRVLNPAGVTSVHRGASLSKAAKETSAEYVSVKLDHPSFTVLVYATLVAGEKGKHRVVLVRHIPAMRPRSVSGE